jgi:hypothetical protein
MLSPRHPYQPLPVPPPTTPPPPILQRSDTNKSRGSKRDSRSAPRQPPPPPRQPEGEPWVSTEPNSPVTPAEQLSTDTRMNSLYAPSIPNTWQSNPKAVPPPPPPAAAGGTFGGYTFPNSSTSQENVASAAPAPPPPVIEDDSRSMTRELQMKGRRMIRGDGNNNGSSARDRKRSTSLTSNDTMPMLVPPPVPNPMLKRSSTGFAYAPAPSVPGAPVYADPAHMAAMRRSRTMSQSGLGVQQQVQPPPPVVSRSPAPPAIRTSSPSSSSSSSPGPGASRRMSRRSVSLNNAGMTPGTRNSTLAPVIPPGGINGTGMAEAGPASPRQIPSAAGMLRRAESTSSVGSNPAYARFNPEEYVDPAFMATDRGYIQSPRVTTR